LGMVLKLVATTSGICNSGAAGSAVFGVVFFGEAFLTGAGVAAAPSDPTATLLRAFGVVDLRFVLFSIAGTSFPLKSLFMQNDS
jgi:hypothetical protein